MKFLDCKSAHEFLELTGLSAEEALKIADRELNELKEVKKMIWKEISKPNRKQLTQLRKRPERLLRIPRHTFIKAGR